MDERWKPEEDSVDAPRRGEHVPPPWFGRDVVPDPDDGEPAAPKRPRRRLTWGLVALILLIIWIPADFVIEYRAREDALARTTMTLGFVWAVGIEVVAVWGLIRLLTRR